MALANYNVALEKAPAREEGSSLMAMATALALRKRFIGEITLAAAVASAVVVFLLPNRYTAVTKNVASAPATQSMAAALLSSLGNNPIGTLAGGREVGMKSSNELYVGLLRTRPIADSLIRRFDLQKVYHDRKITAARKDLAAYTDIVSGKDGLISVSVEDTEKRRASLLANAYIEELRNLTKGLALTESSQRRAFYEEQLKVAKDDLVNAEITFKRTQEQNGILQVDAQAKVLIESVGALRAHIVAKQVEMQALLAYATSQNPQVAVVQRELASLQEELNRLERQSAGADSYAFSLRSAPEAGLAYIRAFREVKYHEALFELMTKQYAAARLDEARDAPLIQIVEPAIEPELRSFPHRTLTIVLFSISGCFAACLLVSLRIGMACVQAEPIRAEQMKAFRAALLGK